MFWAFIWALVTGPFAVLIAILLPKNEEQLEANALSSGEKQRCPYCSEVIKSDALVCRFCGNELSSINTLFQLEEDAWQKAVKGNSEAAFVSYLANHPSGKYTTQAEAKLVKLGKARH